jgi:HD-GYP domain-containing protein (c-di-GMP phosphodiesterase class II)
VAAEDPGADAARLPHGERPIRAAEMVGALSLATDLGTGQPLEHALRTAVLAVRLGELAGASAQELADTYYIALLHASGCTSNGHEAAQLFGEDIEHRAAFFLIDTTNPAEVLAFYRAHVGAGRAPEVRAAMIESVIANAGGPRSRDSFATMCEVAQRFAGWLDLGSSIQAALEYVFARWDGRGFPDVRGDEIPLPMRLLHVARDISLFLTAGGADEARSVVERRAGAAYEPRLAEIALANFHDLLADLDEARMWEQALETEPFPKIWIAGERVDAAFMAIAALTGLKSPWLREHSTGVAELAEAAAWRMGLPDPTVTLVRRAALAHDLGRIGVSNAIWEKPGPLGFGEWERVRLHPHFSERAFAQSQALAPIGLLAGSHHERLDGSGYHRGTRGSALDETARILAAADCYGAMREARPYRPALATGAAEAELLREADEGRLDREAVDAVLAAAGHSVRQRSRELPAGLTERELEVLLVLVHGRSNQEIAVDLGISAKTVGHHVQHVYEKAGVRSRAAATLWAFENDLVRSA